MANLLEVDQSKVSSDSYDQSKSTEEMASYLRATKDALRSQVKSGLSKLSPASVQDQSAAVFKKLIKEKAYVQAKNVGIYLSMPNREIETDPIVRHAFSTGKRVFVPYLHKNEDTQHELARVMDMVDLQSLEDYKSLSRDKWDIPSLRSEQLEGRERILDNQATSHQTSLDLILMPGVAFGIDEETGRIKRLGHGKGFYDFFLDRYYRSIQVHPARNYPFLCGLALERQFLGATPDQQIPVGPLDQLLDAVVIGDGRVVGQMEKGSRIGI